MYACVFGVFGMAAVCGAVCACVYLVWCLCCCVCVLFGCVFGRVRWCVCLACCVCASTYVVCDAVVGVCSSACLCGPLCG